MEITWLETLFHGELPARRGTKLPPAPARPASESYEHWLLRAKKAEHEALLRLREEGRIFTVERVK